MNCEQCVFFNPKKRIENTYTTWCSHQKNQQETNAATPSCSFFIMRKKAKQELQIKEIYSIQKKYDFVKQTENPNLTFQTSKNKKQLSYKKEIVHFVLRNLFSFEKIDNAFFIQTKYDNWKLIVREKGILLFHKNQHGDRSLYHQQHDYYHTNMARLFDYLNWHDQVTLQRNLERLNKTLV